MKNGKKRKILHLAIIVIVIFSLVIIYPNNNFNMNKKNKWSEESESNDVISPNNNFKNKNKNNFKYSNYRSRSNYQSHEPIKIENNGNFTLENGVTSGNGTKVEPFLIDGWEIYSDGFNNCISISDTNKYFKIKNCLFYSIQQSENNIYYYNYVGIEFDTVSNGIIENCTFFNLTLGNDISDSSNIYIKNNSYDNNENCGISIRDSTDLIVNDNIFTLNYCGIQLQNLFLENLIFNNRFNENEYGINVRSSDSIEFINNTLINNEYGIKIYNSYDNKLINNSMENCGIILGGNSEKEFFQYIDSSNHVNNKPIIYLKNEDNKLIPEDAGQVIIASCNNIIIENLNCSNASTGIQISYSSFCKISNNIFNFNRINGISVISSNNNTIKNNIFNNNNYGINFYGTYGDCNDNKIINNSISNNEYGIFYMWRCNNNLIKNNSIVNNHYGITISWSSNSNIITDNLIDRNGNGIKLEAVCKLNIIINNSCINNTYGIVSSGSIDSTVVNKNSINNNIKYGIYILGGKSNFYENNTIFENEIGIYLSKTQVNLKSNSHKNIAKYNTIYNNSNYGIAVNEFCEVEITAKYNYWGDDSGPYHQKNNTDGKGDNVSNRVIFSPWLTKEGELVQNKKEKNDNETDINKTDINNTNNNSNNNYNDSDNDNFFNDWEEFLGSNPYDFNDTPLDTDNDGIPDGDNNNSQPWMDVDDDGDYFNDFDEISANTDPKDPNIFPDKNNSNDNKSDENETSDINEDKINQNIEYLFYMAVSVIIIVFLIILALIIRKKKV